MKKRERRERRDAATEEEEVEKKVVDKENPLEKALNEEDTMSVLSQIQKMVEKNPESVAQLLRNWLFDK